MSARVTFADTCDIRHVRPRTARTVCDAVRAFAEDGSGKIKELTAGGLSSGFVHVYGWAGYAVVEAREDGLYVHAIIARPPVLRPVALLDEPAPVPPADRE
jgi:hypothetical protein